jgi:hypothetical protein
MFSFMKENIEHKRMNDCYLCRFSKKANIPPITSPFNK